ncbi:MAG: OB-fold nucleic acid binding domain-containing protein [Candidatus Undinarchaeales archaeon]|nr:OB-fold nucleic acid binding domain-containing protein [Candidatus Undinarchaeales archaeon]
MSNDMDTLVERIATESEMTADEVRAAIEKKKKALAGLVSETGAAHIVANELGVKTLERTRPAVRSIGELSENMREADIIGRVVRVFPPREFSRKDGSLGRVANIIIGDETGTIRVSFWDKGVEVIDHHGLEAGTPVKLVGGFIKRDNMDRIEMRFTTRSRIVVDPKNAEIPPLEKLATGSTGGSAPAQRLLLRDAVPGDVVRIRATVVQLFENNPLYEVCPSCGKRIRADEKGKFVCAEHGEQEPAYNMVVSATVDDGTNCLRAVFFRDNASDFLGLSVDDVRSEGEKAGDMTAAISRSAGSLLGRELLLEGRVRFNDISDRNELMVNRVSPPNAKAEAEALVTELEGSTGTPPSPS